MNASGQTICLCMIVKNEAHVIERCLASVLPIIDHWIIVDTGSSDGTPDKISLYMKDIPGELFKRPWRDFAFNRSEALRIAQDRSDYTLIIDADDHLQIPAGYELPHLTADSYSLDLSYSGLNYSRTQIVSNDLDWRYRGVLHEFLECEDAKTFGYLPMKMVVNHDGARSRNPSTYKKDIKTLTSAIKIEKDPFLIARYTFYLAQSYFDSGEYKQSIDFYIHRVSLGYWDDEIYFSLFKIGVAKELMNEPLDCVIEAYMAASEFSPARAEPLHAACRACRLAGQFDRGYAIIQKALELQIPRDALFVSQSVYDYGVLDEYAVCAYWTHRYEICFDATLRALESGKVPNNEHPRLFQNIRFAVDRLGALRKRDLEI